MTENAQERHQEGELRDVLCGCQLIWSRGRWHPKLTCREHATDEQLAWDGP